MTEDQKIARDMTGRFIALAIGISILVFLLVKWGDEMVSLVSGSPPPVETVSDQDSEEDSNPGLTACLEKRLGDVHKMKDDGIIDDSQFDTFSKRATDLCRAQNPAP